MTIPLDFAFFETIKKESDRGTALVCTEALYNQLSDLISMCFVNNRLATWSRSGNLLINTSSYKKQVFKYRGVLDAGSERIKVAWLLGLIGEETYLTLEVIRKVRNEFAAHSIQPMSFSDATITAIMSQSPVTLQNRVELTSWTLHAKDGEVRFDLTGLTNPDPQSSISSVNVEGMPLHKQHWVLMVHKCSFDMFIASLKMIQKEDGQ